MNDDLKEKICQYLETEILKFDEPMSRHTTFGIGGSADAFYIAKTTDDLIKAVKLARRLKIPYFVFGGGSNVLVGDEGIRGIVINIKNQKLNIKNTNQTSKIFVEAGVLLPKLIHLATENSLSGLECLVGIPGTVGGAIAGNAGTKQGSISQVVEKVTVFGENNKIYDLDASQCQFDYRSSRFKESSEVVLSVVLKLKKIEKEAIQNKIKEVLQSRLNQPQGRSGGCIFKNSRLANAGYLIENAGFKGRMIGDAKVSEKHANYIINTGKATCADVLKLISLIKEKVWKEFKVRLEEEMVVIGEL